MVRNGGREGATIGFRESDRRDLPGADDRNGDIPMTPAEGQLGHGAEASGPTLHKQIVDFTRHPVRPAIGG